MSDTRERLLDAFEQLVIEQGDRSATLDAVAMRAGVSKGGLIYHFSSREELVDACAQRLVDAAERALADARAEGQSVADFYLSAPDRDDVDLTRTMFVLLRAKPERSRLLAVLERWASRLVDEFPDDPTHAEIVRLVGDGLWFQHLLGQVTDPEVLDAVRSRLLRRGRQVATS